MCSLSQTACDPLSAGAGAGRGHTMARVAKIAVAKTQKNPDSIGLCYGERRVSRRRFPVQARESSSSNYRNEYCYPRFPRRRTREQTRKQKQTRKKTNKYYVYIYISCRANEKPENVLSVFGRVLRVLVNKLVNIFLLAAIFVIRHSRFNDVQPSTFAVFFFFSIFSFASIKS